MTASIRGATAPHAVVVGGTSGIGLATAEALAAAGERVTIVGRHNERLRNAVEQLRAVGVEAEARRADATRRDELDALFTQTGPVEHLVLAATGASGAGSFAELDLDDLRAGFEAKLFAQLGTLQAALVALSSGASVTFITAVSAQTAHPGTAGLAAVNGALEAMVSTLAVELAPVRVNAVSPGVVDTPWWDFLPKDARQAALESSGAGTPVGRVGRPEELAHAVVAVATNPFITGVVLPVDGGLHLPASARPAQ